MDIGPLQSGKELVARFTTDLANEASSSGGSSVVVGSGAPVVYTDDNGLEFVKRVTNLQQPEAIPSNYYPISTGAFIRDEAAAAASKKPRQLTVLTDRAHGAASLSAGELEVMMHRRCNSNDNKGNGENLDETDHITASMMLLVDGVSDAAPLVRRLSIEQNFAPTVLFAPTASMSSFTTGSDTRSSRLLARPLPPNVHLLSLDQRYGSANATVLRLQHIFEAIDQTNLSVPVAIDLDDYLHLEFHLESMVEMTLSANLRQATAEQARLKWRVVNETGAAAPTEEQQLAVGGGANTVTLKPRQIKTFLLNAQPADAAL